MKLENMLVNLCCPGQRERTARISPMMQNCALSYIGLSSNVCDLNATTCGRFGQNLIARLYGQTALWKRQTVAEMSCKPVRKPPCPRLVSYTNIPKTNRRFSALSSVFMIASNTIAVG